MFPDQAPEESNGGAFSLEKPTVPLIPSVEEPMPLSLHQALPIDETTQRRHAESLLKYPHVPINEGEYVVAALRRNTVGLLAIWGVVGLLILFTLVLVPLYSFNLDSIAAALGTNARSIWAPSLIAVPLLIIDALFIIGGLIASRVYSANRLYLTNMTIIQYVQTGLFNTRLKQVNLYNVEDVSSHQEGPLQQIFNYGDLRISTRGHQTIYTFNYLNKPDAIVKLVNDAVETVRNRPAEFRAEEPPVNI